MARHDLNAPDAPPVTLAEAVAQVEAWRDTEGMPLTGLHRIAQVLHGALEGSRLYRDTPLDLLAKARDEIDARDVRLQNLQLELNGARDENARLTAEIQRLTAERDRLAARLTRKGR